MSDGQYPVPADNRNWIRGELAKLRAEIGDANRRAMAAAKSVAGASENGQPAGSVIGWATAAAPPNWLLCQGQAVSRTTYASLFAVIGTLYGAGNGTTTFNVPDFRGRVPVGLDALQTEFDTLGEAFGAKNHTLTQAETPNIPINIRRFDGDANDYLGGSGNPFGIATPWTSGGIEYNIAFTRGGDQPHNNVQPSRVINFIIKASNGDTPGDSQLTQRVSALEGGAAVLPRGKVARVARTTTVNTTSATYVDVPGMSMAFTAEAGRLYRATFTAPSISSSVNGDRGTLLVVINGVQTNVMYQDINALGHALTFITTFTGAGATTVVLRWARDIGSGTMSQLGFTYGPAVGLIEDIGLA